jgi:hypothetical protein
MGCFSSKFSLAPAGISSGKKFVFTPTSPLIVWKSASYNNFVFYLPFSCRWCLSANLSLGGKSRFLAAKTFFSARQRLCIRHVKQPPLCFTGEKENGVCPLCN